MMKKYLIVFCWCIFSINTASTQWSGNDTSNTPICLAPDYQDRPQIVSDGSGGAITVWVDGRNPPLNRNGDIYAQRIGANGYVQWTADGIAVCSNPVTQLNPRIVSDGSGGAIIAWEDLRNNINFKDIYAQRIDSNGVAQWTANGIPVCIANGLQSDLNMVSDGAGGAIITWGDYRAGVIGNIYAQRIGHNGTTLWTTNGVALCPATVNQVLPFIAADASGGAIVVWTDNRTNTYNDIYAQRINGNGILQWSTSGLAIGILSRSQQFPSIASDGAGGAIITWADNRDSLANFDIYVQRVDSNGNHLWTPDGAPVCLNAGDQGRPIVLSDMNGGAIITWHDMRNGSSNRDVYAQRMLSSGSPVWSINGIPICTALYDQDWINQVPDGHSGTIISWEDERAGGSSRNVYAQRVDSSGAIQWAPNGRTISIAPGYKSFSQIIPMNAGDAFIVWGDERNSSDRNIFIQRINYNGTLTSIRLSEQIPLSFSLEQNYPNPFNPTTTIRYQLPMNGHVKLEIYNTLGQVVSTLVDEERSAGYHVEAFHGTSLPSGMYFYKLRAGTSIESKKMMLIK